MTTLPPANVPDSDALRRAMLAASWKRDQRVARRRILARWVLWALGRYGWMVLVAVALVTSAWWWTHRISASASAAPSHPVEVAQVAQTTPTVPAAAPPTETDRPYSMPPLPEHFGQGVVLRLTRWSPMTRPASPVQLPAAQNAGNPSLISEDWLHSKEP